jgi:hypothetical protein
MDILITPLPRSFTILCDVEQRARPTAQKRRQGEDWLQDLQVRRASRYQEMLLYRVRTNII